jgi:hypothetical protein
MDSYYKLLPAGGGKLLDDELAQLIVRHCHARCNFTLLDNQHRDRPGVVDPKRGISLSPVHDNQHALATKGHSRLDLGLRAAVRRLAAEPGSNKLPNLLVTYRNIFHLMREKMHSLGSKSTGRREVSSRSTDPTKPEDDKQDLLMMYDPAWIDPDTHEFLESFVH